MPSLASPWKHSCRITLRLFVSCVVSCLSHSHLALYLYIVLLSSPHLCFLPVPPYHCFASSTLLTALSSPKITLPLLLLFLLHPDQREQLWQITFWVCMRVYIYIRHSRSEGTCEDIVLQFGWTGRPLPGLDGSGASGVKVVDLLRPQECGRQSKFSGLDTIIMISLTLFASS